LRGATRRRLEIQFFPSARPLVPFAADGRSGLGCKGGPRISAWRCKLSTNLSRSRASDGDGEAETAPARRNKVLWPFLRLDGAASDTIDGLESCILAGSGEFFCPSLIFFGDGSAIDAIFSEGLGRFAYHFLEESEERFTCNCLGGLSLSVARLFGALGWPAVLGATEPKFPGVVMASGHPLLLGRSTFLRHVDVFDVLLGEAIKNFVSSSGRASASSCILDVFLFQSLVRWRSVGRLLCAPVTKTAWRPLLGLLCNFLLYRGCFCKNCNVNLTFYI